MSIYKGSTKIKNIYNGNTQIGMVYIGDTLIYGYQSGTKLFESSTPDTYTLVVEYPCTVSITLVGGGGGGASARYSYTHSNHTGGSGSMIYGTMAVQAGTYTIVVGGGGNGASVVDSGNNAVGGDGGDSTLFGQTAGGGKGGWAGANAYTPRGDNGYGGVATITEPLSYTDGVKGDTTGVYVDGIGAGGASATKGNDGYVKIEVV